LLQHECTDLIDDAGALRDQPRPHPMQRLQIQLFSRLGRDEPHRRPLHRFGDRLGTAEVVLLSFRVRPHILRRHQPGIVIKGPELSAQLVRADAGFHPNQARRHIREPCVHLGARPLLPQHNRARSSRPTTWNEFLPMSMPIVATIAVDLSDIAMLLRNPVQRHALAV
jgi:hypothetical protein